jgi:Peptidase family M23
MYFWLSYPRLDAIPSSLQHRFSSTATVAGKTRNFTAEDDGSTSVSENRPLVISPPLSGSGWLDGNGAGPIVQDHRTTLVPTNGSLRPDQVFAIDWSKLDAQGRYYVGDLTKNENWFGYGQPIISATDGVVVVTVDGRPDQIPVAPLFVADLEEKPGNRVIVATRNGQSVEYVMYCHLKPGSVAVKIGQKVHVGQLLGLLGNSGQSVGPHMHFQVSDAPSVYNSNGLPFVINRMYYQSHIVGTPATEGGRLVNQFDTAGKGWRQHQMPLQLDVIAFP